MILTPFVISVAAQLCAWLAAAPRLNVESSCRAASDLSRWSMARASARMRMKPKPATSFAKNGLFYSGPARSRCSAEVMIGGDPSYVELPRMSRDG